MRMLRNFIRSTFKRSRIPKFNFKYVLTNFGIHLTDQEIATIYRIYDEKNLDEISYDKFFSDLTVITTHNIDPK